MLAPFAANNEPILMVVPIGPLRDLIRQALKAIGFISVQAVSTAREAIHFLETEEILPFWIITTTHGQEELTAMHLLTLLLETPELRSISVSLFCETSERDVSLAGFVLGLLSSHKIGTRNAADISSELRTLVRRISENDHDLCLVAAEYLRATLREQKKYEDLLSFERTLMRHYPKQTKQLLAIAEANFLLGYSDDARSNLAQARYMDASLAKQADAIYQRYAGEEALARPLTLAKIADVFQLRSCVVIDPDDTVHKGVEEALQAIGVATVHCETDAKAALSWIAKNGEPGMIVMEWRLNGMTGPAFLQRLRQAGCWNVPVFLLSSLVTVGHQQLIRELGVETIIEKPLSAEHFLKAIISALRASYLPSNYKTIVRKIEGYLTTGQFNEARAAATQLFAIKDKIPSEVQDFLQARLEFADGDPEVARGIVSKLLRDDADNLAYQDLLGKILLKMGEFEAAVLCFKRADAVAPDNIERICAIAEAYTELGDLDLAEEHIGVAKKIDEAAQPVLHVKTRLGLATRNFDAAKAALSSLKNAMTILAYMNNRAVALARSGRPEKGAALYHDALRVLPDNRPEARSAILYNLGLAHIRMGNQSAALPFFAEAGQISSKRVKLKVDAILTKLDHVMKSGGIITIDRTMDEIKSKERAPMIAAPKATPGTVRCYGLFNPTNISLAYQNLKIPTFKKRATFQRGATGTKRRSYAS
jgi:CheY-like chemotaxis protein